MELRALTTKQKEFILSTYESANIDKEQAERMIATGLPQNLFKELSSIHIYSKGNWLGNFPTKSEERDVVRGTYSRLRNLFEEARKVYEGL